MKVLMLTLTRKGICQYTAQLVDALSEYCDVRMISPSGTSEYLSEPKRAFEIRYPFPKYDPRLYGSILQIVSIIKREKPDVLHIQDFRPATGMLLPFVRGVKLVQTLHDIDPHPGEEHWYSRSLRDLVVNRSHAVIVHGESLKSRFTDSYPFANGKVYVSPIGAWTFFRRWMDVDVVEDRSILFFGRILPYKGVDVLLKAAHIIHRALPDYRIIIAGVGDVSPYADLLKSCAGYVQVDNRQIPDEEVAGLFQRCSMVVLPYNEGSQSGILSIAYAFNKPVVVTSVGSVHECVDDGVTGLIVPPGDANSLADAVINLAENEELRNSMSAAIKRKVTEELNWENAAHIHLKVYNDVIEST